MFQWRFEIRTFHWVTTKLDRKSFKKPLFSPNSDKKKRKKEEIYLAKPNLLTLTFRFEIRTFQCVTTKLSRVFQKTIFSQFWHKKRKKEEIYLAKPNLLTLTFRYSRHVARRPHSILYTMYTLYVQYMRVIINESRICQPKKRLSADVEF